MQVGALRSLEFEQIVDVVVHFALTPLGATELAKLHPSTDPRAVRTALATTSECVRYLSSNTPFGLTASTSLEPALTALAVEGHPLETGQLLAIADFLSSVDQVGKAVRHADGGPFPALRTIVDRCRSFEREVKEIRAKIDPVDGVVDTASSELAAIRGRLTKQRNRLRGTLGSYLRGKDTARYLQEQVVTERNGRFVLVVKAEHRGSIPGIVHGSSGSGASLFLEPLSTVEINNDIVALEQDEAKEVRRILIALADAFRKRAIEVHSTMTAATEIDVIQARASFSQLIDGVEPQISADTRVEFMQARHPLLIPAVRARLAASSTDTPDREPVGADIRLVPPTTALIITGPNTGGKTVALKTAGLLSLMAQAGLHVPAGAGSKTTVFRSVFADIGDEQSISASLSTFSGHIANIVAMERQLRLPAMVLLDEIGAGTDPVEGGALGTAIVDHFRQRGALIMATTHDDTLKSYASTTEGVTCAGFGFDPESFAPTYQLTYDSPGRSLALEIAARLGIPAPIIETARKRRSAREAQLAEHLAKVDGDLRKLESERRRLAESRQQLDAERTTLAADRRRADERDLKTRRQLSSGIDAQLRKARDEIETVVEGLRAKASALQQAAATRAVVGGRLVLSTGDRGSLRTEARAAVNDILTRVTTETAPRAKSSSESTSETAPTDALTTPPPVGTRVRVGGLGVEGRVSAVHNTQVEVDVRGKRLHVLLGDLRVITDAGPQADGQVSAPGGGVTVHADTSDGPLPDLNLIGCTVDEARDRVEKHLDRALLREQHQVRIIHGHGTGRLRRSVGRLLERHPQVKHFALAPPEQGGGGATLVELKE